MESTVRQNQAKIEGMLRKKFVNVWESARSWSVGSFQFKLVWHELVENQASKAPSAAVAR